MPGQGKTSFAAVLTRFRTVRNLTKVELARRMSISASYISHLEAGRERGGAEIARGFDKELNAGGEIWRAWQDDRSGDLPGADGAETPSPAGIVVLEDAAELRYDGTVYHLAMRRRLRNSGTEPITRYLVRIAVDRYPGEPERSNALYRSRPLTWDELQLRAHCGGEPMDYVVKHDHDATKEVWLKFSHGPQRFPLYPGQEAEISYNYSVSADKWGAWFQRAVRLPTRQLSVRLAFPTRLHPTVWGTETSLSADANALRTPVAQTTEGEYTVFTWGTMDPALHARFRMEWRTTELPQESEPVNNPAPSTVMAAAGIVQEGHPLLTSIAQPFALPGEAEEAHGVVRALHDTITRVKALHPFGKGMGLAAPQIGMGRAAAVVVPPGEGAVPIVLLNPRVVESSSESDCQYEGCLSFFDVRGLVVRPLSILVEHTEASGEPRLTRFEHGLARLVLHEVDHLEGHLYRTRMAPGTSPIPVEEYNGTGQKWTYG
ncbi:peptide deformylase [Streptomyces sp. NPDC087440]|uniref:peptide deformylase n=1 Tax=Streptomyces sp. NPDC087440 TaxID=3365790 RepID=UPI00381808F5